MADCPCLRRSVQRQQKQPEHALPGRGSHPSAPPGRPAAVVSPRWRACLRQRRADVPQRVRHDRHGLAERHQAQKGPRGPVQQAGYVNHGKVFVFVSFWLFFFSYFNLSRFMPSFWSSVHKTFLLLYKMTEFHFFLFSKHLVMSPVFDFDVSLFCMMINVTLPTMVKVLSLRARGCMKCTSYILHLLKPGCVCREPRLIPHYFLPFAQKKNE